MARLHALIIALHLWLFDLWDSRVAPILFGESSLTLILLTDWIPGHLGAWLTYPVSYGFATSCLFHYRRAFTRLFPPRLQPGTPHFITLNLAARPRTKAADGEDNETND